MNGQRIRNSVFLHIVLLLATISLLSGCARQKLVTEKEALNYGQFVLRQTPPEIDLSALKGKRIVIDPGHGGSFGGAVGPNNLREADVNLGVGLYLWGMLTQAGAEAYLTRMDDSDVYQRADFDLKKDLQARVDFAKALDADLFVSLHHNADVHPGKKKNSLETYFKMSDFGPSLDLAQYVHKQLALSLKQPENSVLPGNYRVLREFPGTAILGEPSYISHAENSFKLGLAPMQRIEAQAYFLGIAEYFSKGVPRIEDIQPAGMVSSDPRPLITASVVADRGVLIDPASIEMRLDGNIVNPILKQEAQIIYLPERRLNNGNHVAQISLRNMKGNAARSARTEFVVARPPAYIVLDSDFETISPDCRQPLRVTAKLLDVDAMPVADGAAVSFAASEGTISPAVANTHDGEATAYLVPEEMNQERTITVSAHAGGLSHDMNIFARAGAGAISTLTIVDASDESPIPGALVALKDNPVGYSDRSGYFACQGGFASGYVTISARGYIPKMFEGLNMPASQIIPLQPIANGLLFGKRIAVDPQAGGEDKGETGPTGVRASDVNLRVAQYLASFLKAAGAETVLTRKADVTTTPLSRVEAAEQFGAQLFISIGHDGLLREAVTGEQHEDEQQAAASSRVMYYPTSKDGQRLAGAIAASVRDGAIMQDAVAEPASDFVLTHTSSPAVVVSMPGPASPAVEERLREPENVKREAYAIYCGILEYMGFDREAARLQVQ